MSKQTIYNRIHGGKFTIGKHFVKPTPKKILFRWSQIEVWLGETSPDHEQCSVNTDFRDKDNRHMNITLGGLVSENENRLEHR